jgi:hypothetical protein
MAAHTLNRFLKLETDQIAEAIREAFTYNDENLVPYLRNLADSIADPLYLTRKLGSALR